MKTYEIAGSLLSQYLDALSATADAQTLTSYELIALERNDHLKSRLTISRERLAELSRERIPAGRL